MSLNRIKTLVILFLERLYYGINFISISNKGIISKRSTVRGARITGDVKIGEYCKIIDGVSLKTSSSITIAHHTSINGPNTDVISAIFPISIGSFTSIARNVSIQEFNHNFKSITSYHIMQNVFGESKKMDIYSNGPIIIGNDVWIGSHCVILSGSRIGNGSIVAANSVVTGDIPPYAVVGGSPARILKYRFDEETIQILEQLKWWDWSIDKIKNNRILFEGNLNIDELKKLLTS